MEDLKYLRPLKAKQLKEWYNEEMVEIEELSFQMYTDATILPLKQDMNRGLHWGCGGVMDSEGKYIEESAIPGFYNFG